MSKLRFKIRLRRKFSCEVVARQNQVLARPGLVLRKACMASMRAARRILLLAIAMMARPSASLLRHHTLFVPSLSRFDCLSCWPSWAADCPQLQCRRVTPHTGKCRTVSIISMGINGKRHNAGDGSDEELSLLKVAFDKMEQRGVRCQQVSQSMGWSVQGCMEI